MLTQLPQKFLIRPIVEQVERLAPFKRLELNQPSGSFFNDPWITKDEFKGTPIGDVLDSLGNIGQARLLSLESAESYTAHADPDDRIHLAIVSNEFSYLVNLDDDKLYHLPVDGQLWHMDTGKVHVATNWGPRTRIHLNVRVLLPKFDATKPYIRLKVLDGDYDWKQLAYTPLMVCINHRIKKGYITGFDGISEKEVVLNTDKPQIFDEVIKSIRDAGINLEVTIS